MAVRLQCSGLGRVLVLSVHVHPQASVTEALETFEHMAALIKAVKTDLTVCTGDFNIARSG